MSLWEKFLNPAGCIPDASRLSCAPATVTVQTVSDAVIGLSYIAIAMALVWSVHERRDFSRRALVYIVAGAIAVCGAADLFSIMTLRVPDDGVADLARVLTAVLSLGAAFVAWPLMPRLLLAYSKGELRDPNSALSAHITAQGASSVLLRENEARIRDMNAQLALLAQTDALTGLINQRRLGEVAEQEWLRCVRDGTPLSLLLVDADHFEQFNVRYGQFAGDSCLRAIATELAVVARRPADVAARFGGEQFVLLLPNTSHDGAMMLAGRIAGLVWNRRIAHQDSFGDGVVTVSVGVATARPGSKANAFPSFIALSTAADLALRQAKQEGRNRVCSAMPGFASASASPSIARAVG